MTNHDTDDDDEQMQNDELLRDDLRERMLRAWESGDLQRDAQGQLLYELRAVEVRLARRGRGNRSGFREWLRANGIPRSTAYVLLHDYARKHGLPLNFEFSDEIQDPEDEEPENGSTTVPFSPSATANVTAGNVTQTEEERDEKAVNDWLAKHDKTTLQVSVPTVVQKNINEMLAYLAGRLNLKQGEVLKLAVERLYEEEKKRDENHHSASDK